MTIESDFYATEPGRQHFRDQLTSIRYCVQEVSACLSVARQTQAQLRTRQPYRRATSTASLRTFRAETTISATI